MTLMARFSGVCPECDERWQPGDLIRAEPTPPGELPVWEHAVCPELSDDLTPNSCWLEAGHEGECKPGGCGHVGRGA